MKTAGTIISAHSTDARVWIEAHGQDQTEAEKLHALHAAAPTLAEALKACADALDIAFEYDGDVFRKHHNDVTNALMSARAALAAAGVLS